MEQKVEEGKSQPVCASSILPDQGGSIAAAIACGHQTPASFKANSHQ
jgi:hypothetical protein